MCEKSNKKVVRSAVKNALNRLRQDGFSALKLPERQFLAVFLMHEEIRNGGIFQWFTNPYSDYAAAALDFLRNSGDEERLDVLTKASALFPAGKIPPTTKERHACVASWTDGKIQSLESLDEQYYKCCSNIYEGMALFASKGCLKE